MPDRPITISLDTQETYRYLWAKYISDADLTRHCAQCLRGPYDRRVNPGVTHIILDQYQTPWYYLCGVTRRWTNNLHIAMTHTPGTSYDIAIPGGHAHIENATHIPILKAHIDPRDPNAHRSEFNTCRNWQFAHYITHRTLG